MEWILAKIEGAIGHLQIAKITTPQIIEVLQKEEALDNFETAGRMRTVAGEVFRYAIQLGKCEHDPVGPTKGAIARPRVKHHFAILDARMLSDLLKRINEYSVQKMIK